MNASRASSWRIAATDSGRCVSRSIQAGRAAFSDLRCRSNAAAFEAGQSLGDNDVLELLNIGLEHGDLVVQASAAIGERWTYETPEGHSVAWVAMDTGRLDAGGPVVAGELAVFEESEQSIDFVAHGDTSFVLGSAVKHPHDLVMGHYSVHTSQAALVQGEAEIQRISARLRSA